LNHSYDILLYGISIGSDPDVYAYWHSSQAKAGRFNLSEYKSATADVSLESGRTRPDRELRAAKYKPLLESWRADVPAIALYQPPTFYATRTPIFGYDPVRLNTVSDRFYNVHEWQIVTAKQPIVKK